MSSMKFEPIKTSRLVIVEYAPEYLNEVFAYRSLPEIYKPYTAKMDNPQALAEYFEEQITEFDNPEGGYSVFLILLNSKVIGEITVSFWDHNNEINEIGFAVHPDYQKQGFASEALKAFIDFLFKKMKRNRIQAGCDYDNIASRKLLEKAGLKMEGHFRKSKYDNGKWVDTCYYAVLRDDL